MAGVSGVAVLAEKVELWNSRWMATYYVSTGPTQAHQEPQQGPGKHSCRPPKHFCRAALGKIFEFFFLKLCILVYFLFLSDGRPPNPTLSMGLGRHNVLVSFLCSCNISTFVISCVDGFAKVQLGTTLPRI